MALQHTCIIFGSPRHLRAAVYNNGSNDKVRETVAHGNKPAENFSLAQQFPLSYVVFLFQRLPTHCFGPLSYPPQEKTDLHGHGSKRTLM